MSENPGPFEYWMNCVGFSSGEIIDYVTDPDRSTQISYAAFARNVNLEPMREAEHPAMYRISAPDNWAISFHRSELPTGQRVYYFDWSRIEHMFLDPASGPVDPEEMVELARRAKNPNGGALPALAKNMLVVRVKDSAKDELLPEYLYYVLVHLYNQGLFALIGHRTQQQCIQASQVKQFGMQGGGTLGALVDVRVAKEKDLQLHDTLLMRVGEDCGRPSLVVSVDPLVVRTADARAPNPAGGLAAGRSPAEFDPAQLAHGTRVEMEHTGDVRMAERIAMDHLVEHPGYYVALAKMEKELDAQGNPWVGRRPPQFIVDDLKFQARPGGPLEHWRIPNPAEPSGHAFNYWINFVVYAVVGQMAQADSLMAQHGGDIRRVARWMMARRKQRIGALYRGVLIDPKILDREWLKHEPERKFVSWSQNKDVACWFADPRSVISDLVSAQQPDARGYIVAGKGDPKKVLWHHAWTEVPLPDGRVIDLYVAASRHPEVDYEQFVWNVHTQKEVITESPRRAGSGGKMRVFPIEEKCPDMDIDELDARYTFPPFLAERLAGL